MRGFVLACLLLSSVADAQAPACAPDIPADLQLVCHKGVVTAISESAHQAMIFEGRSCGGTRSISL